MTARMRELRRQPLLSPPRTSGEEVPVTRQDVELMVAQLESARREANPGQTIAKMHYHMSVLGRPQPVTDEDVAHMRAYLAEGRMLEGGMLIAGIHRHMRELGVGERITGDDERLMKARFEEARAGKDAWSLILMHDDLRRLGLAEPMTDDEKALMSSSLRHAEDSGSDGAYVRTYVKLAELGLAPGMTAECRRRVRNNVEEARGRNDTTSSLAEAHYISHRLLAAKDEHDDGGMPPLRRFRP